MEIILQTRKMEKEIYTLSEILIIILNAELDADEVCSKIIENKIP